MEVALLTLFINIDHIADNVYTAYTADTVYTV